MTPRPVRGAAVSLGNQTFLRGRLRSEEKAVAKDVPDDVGPLQSHLGQLLIRHFVHPLDFVDAAVGLGKGGQAIENRLEKAGKDVAAGCHGCVYVGHFTEVLFEPIGCSHAD
jgi:hypothetical protein